VVSLPGQRGMLHADEPWCTYLYETTNETEPPPTWRPHDRGIRMANLAARICTSSHGMLCPSACPENRRVLQTTTAYADLRSMTCVDAGGLHRRLRRIPCMSYAAKIGLGRWIISLGDPLRFMISICRIGRLAGLLPG
jgi:hypothetical protein